MTDSASNNKDSDTKNEDSLSRSGAFSEAVDGRVENLVTASGRSADSVAGEWRIPGSLVGADGLGKPVVRALNTVNISQGFEAGLAIVLVAIILDRLCKSPNQKEA